MNNKHNLGKTLTALAAVMLAGLAAPMAAATHGCPGDNGMLVQVQPPVGIYTTSGQEFAVNSGANSVKADRLDNIGIGAWKFTAVLDPQDFRDGARLSVRVVDAASGCASHADLSETGTFTVTDASADYYFEVILSEVPSGSNAGPYEFTATLERIGAA